MFLRIVKLVFYVVEKSPVARTPAVDALFHVAYNQIACIFAAHRFFQQHLEVFPLYGAGILKLVYHHVVQLGTDFLEDER